MITDEEILRELGPLIWSAFVAFGSDPDYFRDMVTTAKDVEHRRRLFEARRAEAS